MSICHNFPVPRLVWSSPAIAATGNSGAFDMPMASAYAWIVEILTDSGTSPTIDVALQITPDGGTTWWSVSRFAQVTTSDTRLIKTHCNGPIGGQAAAVATIADTGGVLETNFVATSKMRVLATVGGTNPAFATFKVWLIPIANLATSGY
jgi:hypothetical protein